MSKRNSGQRKLSRIKAKGHRDGQRNVSYQPPNGELKQWGAVLKSLITDEGFDDGDRMTRENKAYEHGWDAGYRNQKNNR